MCVCMYVLRGSFSDVFNVDYKSEAFSVWFLAKQVIAHEMVLRGLSSSAQVQTRLLSRPWCREAQRHACIHSVGSATESDKKPLFGNHQ